MKIVALYRVSTDQQGESGLGLAAQQRAIRAYAKAREAKIVGEHTEIESGRSKVRPQLRRAIAAAKKARATLVVSTLDRIGRRVSLIAQLMEAGVKFDCADRPGADPFRLHIESAIAEEEARKIAERTRKALAEYKADGGKLGSHRPNGKIISAQARERGMEAHKANAAAWYAAIMPLVTQERKRNATLQEIAELLNDQGYVTTRGLPFTPTAVHRLLARV